MSLRRYVVTAVFVLAALGGGALAGRFYASAQQPPPTPRPSRAERLAPQRWEYASLTRAAVGPGRGGLYWISYFSNKGVRVVEVEEQATEQGGPAKAIAQLGMDGWEMVGQGPLEIRQGGLNAIYFKRPRS
jgi:hypothetical protein